MHFIKKHFYNTENIQHIEQSLYGVTHCTVEARCYRSYQWGYQWGYQWCYRVKFHYGQYTKEFFCVNTFYYCIYTKTFLQHRKYSTH